MMEIKTNGDLSFTSYLPVSAGNCSAHTLQEYWEAGYDRIWADTRFTQYSEENIAEIFSDAYIPPEFIKSNKNVNSKIDSWVFGIILFNMLFGHSQGSYFLQLKEWYELNIS